MSSRFERGQPAVWSRIVLLSILGVALAGAAPRTHAPPGQARGSVRFVSGHGVTIPIGTQGNQIAMRGRLQGKDSVWVVLDSGAGGTAIDSGLAARTGLKFHGRHQALGAGGAVTSSIVNGIRLELPGVELRDQSMGTVPLEAVGAQGGRRMDVILGYPLLSRHVVIVDYPGSTLEIHDPGEYVYRGTGVSVPLEFIENLPYVTARVKLPGREPIEGKFVIDTGSSVALILAPDFVTREKALESVSRTMQTSGRGVGGASQNPIGRVDALELGTFDLSQPTTVFRGAGAGHISAAGTAGNIGGMIMRRFKVIFDYPNGRMILEPGPDLGAPFEADMSGLGLTSELPDYRVIRVMRVQEGSPAAEVGLRAGDRIESIDGHAADEIGVLTLKDWFRRDGVEYRLGIRRGEERLEVTLKTRRMI